mmetsp:Transcript_22335/g.62293  ORF Transcript_22335/g.62293 Transcript_22335/m.62293 type:complete len:157 (-) Transcript_22335:426-896(-)
MKEWDLVEKRWVKEGEKRDRPSKVNPRKQRQIHTEECRKSAVYSAVRISRNNRASERNNPARSNGEKSDRTWGSEGGTGNDDCPVSSFVHVASGKAKHRSRHCPAITRFPARSSPALIEGNCGRTSLVCCHPMPSHLLPRAIEWNTYNWIHRSSDS